ncbi:IS3 family transposase [Aerococcaceae bacterium DSM 109653]|uniref:IS3 family transposase n=1 Tax=Fundicoccus ignavus TaxID=2664442 RepID=A0A844BS50_9LACT|nr:IS3 family transposase [Fundicoccus ignavus]
MLALGHRGHNINHKRVLRIMRENHLLCLKFTRKSRRYLSFKGEKTVVLSLKIIGIVNL